MSRPTVEGWYWMDHGQPEGPVVVRLFGGILRYWNGCPVSARRAHAGTFTGPIDPGDADRLARVRALQVKWERNGKTFKNIESASVNSWATDELKEALK